MDPITLALLAAVVLTSGDTATRGRGHVYAGHAWGTYRGTRKRELTKARERARKEREKRLRKTLTGRLQLWAEHRARTAWGTRREALKAVRAEWPARRAVYAARREAAAARRARIREWLLGPDEPAPQPVRTGPDEGTRTGADEDPRTGPALDPGGAGRGPADPSGAPPNPTPQPAREQPMPRSTPPVPTAAAEIQSLGGWIDAWRSMRTAAGQLTEDGASQLGLTGAAIAPASDVLDSMDAAIVAFTGMFTALIEAANATPQGAEAVTVAQARTE